MRHRAIRAILAVWIVIPVIAGLYAPAQASVPLTVDFSDGYTFSGVQRTTKTGAIEEFIESPIGPFTLSGDRGFVQLSWNKGQADGYLNCDPEQFIRSLSETVQNRQTNHYSVDLSGTLGQIESLFVAVPTVDNAGIGTTAPFALDAVTVTLTYYDPAVGEITVTMTPTTPNAGDDAGYLATFNPPLEVEGVFSFDVTFTGEVDPPLSGDQQIALLGCPPPNDDLEESMDFGLTQIFLRNPYVVLVVEDAPINNPPVIDVIGDQTHSEGEEAVYTITASDPDLGDELAWTVLGAPVACAPFINSPTSVQIRCSPDAEAGVFTVTVEVSDLAGATDMVTFTLTIAPFLDAGDDRTVAVGELTSLAPDASDGATIDFDLDNDGTYETPGPTVVFYFEEVGVYPIGVRATKNGAVSTDVVTVTVTQPNQPPGFDFIDDQTVNEGQTVVVPITASDPDGDAITISLAQGPSFIQVDDDGDGNATMTISPTHDDAGEFLVALRVAEVDTPLGQFTDIFIIVTVNDVNRNPNLLPIDDVSLNEGDSETITITGSDPDGDDLIITGNLPAFASLTDNGNGAAEITFNPNFDSAGVYTASIEIQDDGNPNLSDTETFTITITNVNRNPNIAPVGDVALNESESTTITISASDPDGDNLTISHIFQLPEFCTLTDNGDGTATLACNPGLGDAGNYVVTVEATDDGDPNLSDEVTFNITVNAINRPPDIDPVDDQHVAEGDELFGTITATDPNGDPITLSASGLPSFCEFTDNGDGMGTLVCNPGVGDAGEYQVTIFASDGELQDAEVFVITVREPNGAPVLDDIDDVTVREGETTTITISSRDPDGDPLTLSANLPGFAEFTDNGDGAGTITVSPEIGDAGTYSISITASDDGDPVLSDTQSFIVTVGPVEGPGVESYDELKTLVRAYVDNRIVEALLIATLNLAQYFDEDLNLDAAAVAMLRTFIALARAATLRWIDPVASTELIRFAQQLIDNIIGP